jgi:hypothetical protein
MSPLRADLIWFAGFESYDTTSGPAPLRIASTGAEDTFSGTTSTAATLAASSCEVMAGPSGNVLSLTATGNGTEGTVSLRVTQSALSGIPEGGVLVASFDITLAGKNGFSLANEARAAKGRSGKSVYLPAGREDTSPKRAVIVVNNSGGPLSLPGSLGELPNNSMASYFFDGSSYAALQISNGNVLTLPISGFCTGLSKSGLDAGVILAATFDNFGAWNAISDRHQNVSVLSLPPGTVVGKP